MKSPMESKTATGGWAAIIVAAVVQGLAAQDLTLEMVAIAVLAGVGSWAGGWFKRNGNLSRSTLEAVVEKP